MMGRADVGIGPYGGGEEAFSSPLAGELPAKPAEGGGKDAKNRGRPKAAPVCMS